MSETVGYHLRRRIRTTCIEIVSTLQKSNDQRIPMLADLPDMAMISDTVNYKSDKR